jgi:hypothetical protein
VEEYNTTLMLRLCWHKRRHRYNHEGQKRRRIASLVLPSRTRSESKSPHVTGSSPWSLVKIFVRQELYITRELP